MLMVPVLLMWMFMLQLAAAFCEQGSSSGFLLGSLLDPHGDRGSSTSFCDPFDLTSELLIVVPFPSRVQHVQPSTAFRR
jgi:hypothetical protein